MTKMGEVYLCEICGNKVRVLEQGGGTLVCCGQDITLVARAFSKQPMPSMITVANIGRIPAATKPKLPLVRTISDRPVRNSEGKAKK